MSAHPRDLAGDVVDAINQAFIEETGLGWKPDMLQRMRDAAHFVLARESAVRERPVPALVEETLRDRFAMAALPAIVALSVDHGMRANECAEEAYLHADAMLAARQVKP